MSSSRIRIAIIMTKWMAFSQRVLKAIYLKHVVAYPGKKKTSSEKWVARPLKLSVYSGLLYNLSPLTFQTGTCVVEGYQRLLAYDVCYRVNILPSIIIRPV